MENIAMEPPVHATVQMPDVEETQIVVDNFTFSVQENKNEKKILQNIKLAFQPGKLSVVLGPSGSGKTTLLSLMAGVSGAMPASAKQSGLILMNGKETSSSAIRKLVGFVFQDDVILETMTVQEAIDMSIQLRIAGLTDHQKKELLNRTISISQLEKAKKTVIGSPMKKGISGGERKRTAIAMELVSNPSVMLLDEPTSGLDTYTAYRIMSLLRRLAHRYGRTVIATLHQPSSEIFHMIDDLFVLYEGQLVYGGPAKDMVSYFTAIGYNFDHYSNPLDILFMNILNKSKNDEFAQENNMNNDQDAHAESVNENTTYVALPDLADYYSKSVLFQTHVLTNVESPQNNGVNETMFRFRAKGFISFFYLFKRELRNVYRNPLILRTKLFQTLFLAAFIALVFWNTGASSVPALYQNIAGVLFFLIINAFFSSFNNVLPVFGAEKGSFSREHSQGYYGLTSYFSAKILVELPFTVIFPILTSIITYWALGLRAGFIHFFVFTIVLILVALNGFSFGLLAASLFNDIGVALALSILFILPLMIFAGLFLNVDTVPVWLRWIQWISPLRYTYSAAMENQFSGWDKPGSDAFYNNSGVRNGFSLFLNLTIASTLFSVALILSYFALLRVVKKNKGKIRKTK